MKTLILKTYRAIKDNLFSVFTGIFFLITAYLLIYEKAGSFTALTAASVSLLAKRFDDLKSLKLSAVGLEFELQEKIREVQATILQLHFLAKETTKFILEAMQADGRWGGGFTQNNKEKIKNNLFKMLTTLGIEDRGIEEVRAVEYPYIQFDYAGYVTRNITPTAQQTDAWNNFFASNKRKGIGFEANPDELEEFLNSIGMLDEERKQRLEDYRFFLIHKTHRRPNEWTVRNKPT